MKNLIKKAIFILVLMNSMGVISQDLPSEPATGYAFPIGSKFTIKMHPIDSINFNYSIIKYEPFQEIVDMFENDYLFEEEGEKGTIEFYYCFGTSGETDAEKEKNMKVLLIMKNFTAHKFEYNSDIQVKEDGEFEKTSNVGVYPGAKAIEMWPYMIHHIALNEFKKAG